jgi:hypothetical protein
MGQMMGRGVLLAIVALVAGCLQIIGYEDRHAGWVPCEDGYRDGDETDVDCGGSCTPCVTGKSCKVGGDCESHVCTGGTCIAPSCGDKVQNEEETDVDCGGGHCPGCSAGKRCEVGTDCKSGVCTGGTCQATCKDGEKDGMETAVDCGGPACPGCAAGKMCAEGRDCESGVCQAEVCVDYGVWAKSFGDQEPQAVTNLAVDAASSVLIAGTNQGTVNFGGAPITAAPGSMFVAKLDKDGAYQWSHGYGYTGDPTTAGLATDMSQNVFLAGTFKGQISFGGPTLASGGVNNTDVSIFLTELDASGNYLWGKAFSGGFLQTVFTLSPAGLAVSTSDAPGAPSVFLVGGFYGSASFGGAVLTNAGGSSGGGDIFIAAYDSLGDYYWSKNFGDVADQLATSVAYSQTDDTIVVGGSFSGTVDFGGGAMTSGSPNGDAFLVKLNADGSFGWAKQYAVGVQQGGRVALDSVGNIYFTGAYTQSPDLGGGPVAAADDAYLLKLDPSGNFLWARTFGVKFPNGAYPPNIAVNNNGTVTLTGGYEGTVDLGGGPLPNVGFATAAYVARFGSNGDYLWSRGFGDPNNNHLPTGVGTDNGGHVFLAGSFDGQMDFGSPTNPLLLTSLGQDIFVAKLLVP